VTTSAHPIVVFGGFLSYSMLYKRFRDALAHVSGQPVWGVGTTSRDWLPSVSRLGWSYLLRKLDRTVQQAARDAATGKVILIGHSAGGVLSRLYLSPDPFLGRAYIGLERVAHLVTLGSPHNNGRRLMYGGLMSHWVERHYPGAFFASHVHYTSIAGSAVFGDQGGSLAQRHAYRVYRGIVGDGNVWGDGLIPVTSALLSGAQQITLDDVGHFAGFGASWYGTPEVIERWWSLVTGKHLGVEK
jgi:pimeloyl-ACP methyl ester carboxylesterase